MVKTPAAFVTVRRASQRAPLASQTMPRQPHLIEQAECKPLFQEAVSIEVFPTAQLWRLL
ncbi:hypothetical protein QBD00_003418 [Ochrobactrum sp. AN78]|nr:hypothetical protein [Ochrobactrum sp. AN78]